MQSKCNCNEDVSFFLNIINSDTHMLKLSNSSRAGGRVLAHTHGAVVIINLTDLALLAVMVEAGI